VSLNNKQTVVFAVVVVLMFYDDAIVQQERNKPKDAPRKPKSAPFFLPTVAGLTPKFVLPQEEEGRDKKVKFHNCVQMFCDWMSNGEITSACDPVFYIV